jgi:hypothetical protein
MDLFFKGGSETEPSKKSKPESKAKPAPCSKKSDMIADLKKITRDHARLAKIVASIGAKIEKATVACEKAMEKEKAKAKTGAADKPNVSNTNVSKKSKPCVPCNAKAKAKSGTKQ